MKIRVVGKAWTIDHVDRSVMVMNGVEGLCIAHEQRMLIAQGQTQEANREAVIHELLHAVWASMGLGYPDEEEQIVNVLAKGLAAVIADNPQATVRRIFS